MNSPIDRRVRRAKDKDTVINELTGDGVFQTIRDVLVFAAAVGHKAGQRVPFTDGSEPVRWDTMTKSPYFEAIVDMISAADGEARPELLSDAYLDERIRAFEEFANGGLQILQRELRSTYGQPFDIVAGLVAEALRENPDADDLSVKDLADELLW